MKTKDSQGKLWSTAPQDWAKFLEPQFIPLYRKAFENVQISEETILLDAGCGSGLFLHMASAKGAKIYGVDAAPGLLKITKQRMPEGTFLLEDLEDLPFSENSFDVVTGFNSFQFAGDKVSAINHAKMVVKKGGKIVVVIWDDAKNSDASSVFASIAALLPPPPPDAPSPWALSEEGRVESIAAELDLQVLHKEKVECPWTYTSLEDVYKAFMCTGPAVKASETLGVEKVKEVIKQGMEPFRLADEVYFLNNQYKFFILEK